jgi:hypothetical protein
MNVAARLREVWPHSNLTADTLAGWGRDLEDLPGDRVAAAVEALVRDEREHAPHSGTIRAKVVDLALDPPEWAEVVAELRGETMVLPELGCVECHDQDVAGFIESENGDMGPCECRLDRDNARKRHLVGRHPLILKFEALVGDRVGAVEEGGNAEARLRMTWESFIRRERRDAAYKGLPSAGLRTLERVNGTSSPKQLGDVIRQLPGGAKAA